MRPTSSAYKIKVTYTTYSSIVRIATKARTNNTASFGTASSTFLYLWNRARVYCNLNLCSRGDRSMYSARFTVVATTFASRIHVETWSMDIDNIFTNQVHKYPWKCNNTRTFGGWTIFVEVQCSLGRHCDGTRIPTISKGMQKIVGKWIHALQTDLCIIQIQKKHNNCQVQCSF